jgi:hypothetical protein
MKNKDVIDETKGFIEQLSRMVLRGSVNLGDEMNQELRKIRDSLSKVHL